MYSLHWVQEHPIEKMVRYKGKEPCFPENNVFEIEKNNYSLHQNPEEKTPMNIDKLIIATIYLIYVFNIVDKPKENLINKTSKATLY